MAELLISRHARLAADRRGITRGSLRSCIYHPDETHPGRGRAIEVRSKRTDGRELIAVVHTAPRYIRLVTAYWRDEDDRQ